MNLGQRNNNPLNIRRGKTLWKGEKTPSTSPVKGENKKASPLRGGLEGSAFCRFESPAWGIRAAFCLLRTYRNKYKAVCIEDIITRWAPPSENDTAAYIRTVCKLTGFGGKERLTEDKWPRLIKAMAIVESGWHLPEETINKGYELYKGEMKN